MLDRLRRCTDSHQTTTGYLVLPFFLVGVLRLDRATIPRRRIPYRHLRVSRRLPKDGTVCEDFKAGTEGMTMSGHIGHGGEILS